MMLKEKRSEVKVCCNTPVFKSCFFPLHIAFKASEGKYKVYSQTCFDYYLDDNYFYEKVLWIFLLIIIRGNIAHLQPGALRSDVL